ncbi:hypothetical protein [Methylobacterium nodulans]|uniref:SGNH hydrolase-type esterase domain-containing protein n=1 Tax=Methylobacterium nodulans (strain LMG 21967 / CNCM I-2342 / ORS 2060) TaxID=460265 RepID=B8IGC8_METNO|nr:hypothetical protein [Methylobacterium nodulans]ACL55828.1 hypothetical protein Mnod_0798 [Methylobacterium nodulans ORS 2060]
MGLLADLIARLSGEAAKDYGHRYVGPATDPIVPDEDYVRVWLRSARITDVRRWTQKFYPTVHARFVHADPVTGIREVMSVISPSKTFQELDSRHLDRFITVNQSLLGPIPYRGELTSEIALFSVAADDLAKPYLDLLSELTASAAGSYLAAVEPLIAPLRRGAEVLLLDSSRAELEIGLARTDTGLTAGNIVVARTEKGGPGLNGLTIDKDDFRLLDGSGRPVADFPYMVIGIERLRARADFRNIPEIRAGWKRIWDAAQRGDEADTVLTEFRTLMRTIRFSPDLVQRDRTRVIGVLAEELRQAGYSLDGIPGLPPAAGAQGPAVAAAEVPVPPRLPESIAAASAWNPAAGRIPLAEARRMIMDPSVPEPVVRQLLIPDPAASRPFAPAVKFNPAVVAIETPQIGLEGIQLMSWANELAEWRRQNAFLRRIDGDDPRPVLVSVGDSWFQFPVFLDDVIDQLGAAYSIWSLDAAGDTLDNMILRQKRHIAGLERWKDRARALLVSGSGNDIVGEDPDGISVLTKILKPFSPGKEPAWYLDTGEFARRLGALRACFDGLFAEVAQKFPGLPVICHGYDHAIPARAGDPRHPLWARQDQWLTGPMSDRLGIRDPDLRQAIVRLLIDRLNEMLIGLCGGNRGGTHANAWHVDVRGTVSGRWADELHPTDEGFAAVGRLFGAVLHEAIGAGEGAGPEAVSAAAPAALEAVFRERAETESEAPDLMELAEAGLPKISERAFTLIVEHETGGRRYYETVYRKQPVWPAGNSGITIGFGYDLGYVTPAEFDRDWAALPGAVRARLAETIGRHGGSDSDAEMRALLASVRDIQIEWELGEAVFRAATLPKFTRATVAALGNTAELAPDCFGALVSLTFNRGASYRKARDPNDPKDRYREMRGIRAAMAERRFADVPALIRLMKRIWRGTSIEAEMLRRREDEAVLFEAGLAGMEGGGVPTA